MTVHQREPTEDGLPRAIELRIGNALAIIGGDAVSEIAAGRIQR